MRRVSMGAGVVLMVLSLAAPPSFAGAKEQIAAMNDLMRTGQGITVQDHHGNDVGKVVALAARNDEVAYFMVALNGNEGKITPIPFSAARFDSRSNTVVLLDRDDSGLAQAPAVSPDQERDPGDSELDSRGHAYYGQEQDQQKESGGMESVPQGKRIDI